MKWLIMVAILLLSACATPYQKSRAFSGSQGYKEYKVTESLTRVEFEANGYTNADATQRYALLRCAEYAADHNKSYFLLFPTLFDAALGNPAREPSVGHFKNGLLAVAYIQLLEESRADAINTTDALRTPR